MISGDMGDKLNSYFTTSLASEAFFGCASLTSITIPSAITEIVANAFSGCTSLTSIDLSSCTSLTSIGNFAFAECADLTTLKLPPAMFVADNQASIGSLAFLGCASLNAIYLPVDATTLPNSYDSNAFTNCPTSGTI
jgi:hypothetical protein